MSGEYCEKCLPPKKRFKFHADQYADRCSQPLDSSDIVHIIEGKPGTCRVEVHAGVIRHTSSPGEAITLHRRSHGVTVCPGHCVAVLVQRKHWQAATAGHFDLLSSSLTRFAFPSSKICSNRFYLVLFTQFKINHQIKRNLKHFENHSDNWNCQ